MRKPIRDGKTFYILPTSQKWKPEAERVYQAEIPEVAPGKWLVVGGEENKLKIKFK